MYCTFFVLPNRVCADPRFAILSLFGPAYAGLGVRPYSPLFSPFVPTLDPSLGEYANLALHATDALYGIEMCPSLSLLEPSAGIHTRQR